MLGSLLIRHLRRNHINLDLYVLGKTYILVLNKYKQRVREVIDREQIQLTVNYLVKYKIMNSSVFGEKSV